MNRQLVVVQLGQCGNQVGLDLFRSLSEEAVRCGDSEFVASVGETFFRSETEGDPYARAVMIDTEPKVISGVLEQARKSSIWQYRKENCFTKQSGAANNWAAGYVEHGPQAWESMSNAVRREMEACDLCGGIILLGSVAGGTGSGVGAYVAEQLNIAYPNDPLFPVVVWPYSSGEVIVQNYNACLALSHLSDVADAVLVMENDHLHQICTCLLHIPHATFSDVNKVLAQQLAHVFLPCQRAVSVPLGGLSLSAPLALLHEPLSNLCPRPGYPLLTLRTIPQLAASSVAFSSHRWKGLLRHLHQMLIVNAYMDEAMDWSVSLGSLGSEGKGGTRHVNRSLANMLVLRGGQLSSADVSPFKNSELYPAWSVGSCLMLAGHNYALGGVDKCAALLSNSQGVLEPLDTVVGRATEMFESRAYTHQYLAQGIEEDAFKQAFVQLEQFIENYKALG